jgi:salicylate hydroxylase
MANGIMTESYHSGMMYEFDSEYGEDYERLGPAIQRQWDWINRVSLDEEVASALSLARDKSLSKL